MLGAYDQAACAFDLQGTTIPDLVQDAYKQVTLKGSPTLLSIEASQIGQDGAITKSESFNLGYIEFNFRVENEYWSVVYLQNFKDMSKLRSKIEPSGRIMQDPNKIGLSSAGVKKLEKLPSVFFPQAKAAGIQFPVQIGMHKIVREPRPDDAGSSSMPFLKPALLISDVIMLTGANGKRVTFEAATEDILE
jgi:hypothetical protein